MKIIINEVRAALDAGADVVQFDAPDILQFDVYGEYNPDKGRAKERVRRAVELNNEVLSKLPTEHFKRIQVIINCWVILPNLLSVLINELPGPCGIHTPIM
ncbi:MULTISPECIES: hypothetical protein [Vulcanisaeta]|uniref:Uncharacterized protein n=1 Tax=Vulcanisaeta souniana JCM 11219 TaxID=1293586 RepID=A0A830E1Z8_9CREN|nr:MULTISPECIES: hypothetical protein [Vulcanisaeta]GGI74833.1 hypothetical protein GCM10007112_09520 [Vulcanisaeta souniana JCM 11219]